MEAQIAKDVLPKFVEHLDRIGRSNRISLVLYTNGVYNPTRQLPNGASMPLPVSVESVRAYMEMAKNEMAEKCMFQTHANEKRAVVKRLSFNQY